MHAGLRSALSLSRLPAALLARRPPRQPFCQPLPCRRPAALCAARRAFSFSRNTRVLETVRHEEKEDDDQTSGQPETITGLLPLTCPGCGALSQTVDASEAGYFTTTRGPVKAFLRHQAQPSETAEDAIFADALQEAETDALKELGLKNTSRVAATVAASPPPPICDRCHNILHHSAGVPIIHPTLDSIEAIIDESPYKHNHIYHVIDAADFPMSVIPNIYRTLNLARPRTQNRRSKHVTWHRGRITDLSFIITRSDLLAPKKEMVDHMMHYIQTVLRDALGPKGQDLRLGNVHCVSAKRGWWTPKVKEKIYEHGGGNWMVGMVNVGKSNLFEVVFPKGKGDDVNIQMMRRQVEAAVTGTNRPKYSPFEEPKADPDVGEDLSLLPPPQPEVPYPVMPTISSLPGTTASPIRVPFGNGKGELIDLPGLERPSLEPYVLPEHRSKLWMTSRVVPERLTLKPGQSLLLGGGLVHIKPATEDLIFLAASFVPGELNPHVTSNWKAEEFRTGTREKESGLEVITTEEAQQNIKSAGRFRLKWDVTKEHAGPLTRRDDVGLRPDRLPFKVVGIDILIEGCGWVEIIAQIRKGKRLRPIPSEETDAQSEDASEAAEGNEKWYPDVPEEECPEVEVFTPYGKHIGTRRCMNGYLIGGPKPKTAAERKRKRPRLSMKSVKARRPPQRK